MNYSPEDGDADADICAGVSYICPETETVIRGIKIRSINVRSILKKKLFIIISIAFLPTNSH